MPRVAVFASNQSRSCNIGQQEGRRSSLRANNSLPVRKILYSLIFLTEKGQTTKQRNSDPFIHQLTCQPRLLTRKKRSGMSNPQIPHPLNLPLRRPDGKHTILPRLPSRVFQSLTLTGNRSQIVDDAEKMQVGSVGHWKRIDGRIRAKGRFVVFCISFAFWLHAEGGQNGCIARD
jgi:hypothetical protein